MAVAEGEAEVVVVGNAEPDFFATGVLPPEDCGEFIRITPYADRMDASGRVIRILLRPTCYPRAAFFQSLYQVMEAMIPGGDPHPAVRARRLVN